MAQDFGEMLKKHGVLREGHFLLSSGKHSDKYFEKFRILEQPLVCEAFAKAVAERFGKDDAAVVCGPTTGGVIIAYEVARVLGIPCAFAERVGEKLEFRRGFQFRSGERVLVVEDIVTTGGSAREVVEAARQAGADPIGAAVLVNRSGKPLDLGTPAIALLDLDIASYLPAECPLCHKGLLLYAPGSKGTHKTK